MAKKNNFIPVFVVMTLAIVLMPSVLADNPFEAVTNAIASIGTTFTEFKESVDIFFKNTELFFLNTIVVICIIIYFIVVYGLSILPVRLYMNIYNNNMLVKKVFGETTTGISDQYRYFSTKGKQAINVTSKVVGGVAKGGASIAAGGIAGAKIAGLKGTSKFVGVLGGMAHGAVMATPARVAYQPIYKAATGVSDIDSRYKQLVTQKQKVDTENKKIFEEGKRKAEVELKQDEKLESKRQSTIDYIMNRYPGQFDRRSLDSQSQAELEATIDRQKETVRDIKKSETIQQSDVRAEVKQQTKAESKRQSTIDYIMNRYPGQFDRRSLDSQSQAELEATIDRQKDLIKSQEQEMKKAEGRRTKLTLTTTRYKNGVKLTHKQTIDAKNTPFQEADLKRRKMDQAVYNYAVDEELRVHPVNIDTKQPRSRADAQQIVDNHINENNGQIPEEYYNSYRSYVASKYQNYKNTDILIEKYKEKK